VNVTDPTESVLDVVLRTRAGVVDDVARVVVDLDPIATDRLEQLEPCLRRRQEIRAK
jgi:hypothetical protein